MQMKRKDYANGYNCQIIGIVPKKCVNKKIG
jgi:hypothetical protein